MEKKFTRIKCPVCGALFKIDETAVSAECKFCGSAFEMDGEGHVTGGAFVGKGIGPETKKAVKKAETDEAQGPETVSYTSDELEDPEFKEQTKHMGTALRNIIAGAVGVLATVLVMLGVLTMMTGLAGK